MKTNPRPLKFVNNKGQHTITLPDSMTIAEFCILFPGARITLADRGVSPADNEVVHDPAAYPGK